MGSSQSMQNTCTSKIFYVQEVKQFYQNVLDGSNNSFPDETDRRLFHYLINHLKWLEWGAENPTALESSLCRIETELTKKGASAISIDVFKAIKESLTFHPEADGNLAKFYPNPERSNPTKRRGWFDSIFRSGPQTLTRHEISDLRTFFLAVKDNGTEVCNDKEMSMLKIILRYLEWLEQPRDDKKLRLIYESYRQEHRGISVTWYQKYLYNGIWDTRDRLKQAKGQPVVFEILDIMRKFLELGDLPLTAFVPQTFAESSPSPPLLPRSTLIPKPTPKSKSESNPQPSSSSSFLSTPSSSFSSPSSSLSPPVYNISIEAFKRLTTGEMTGNLNESLNTWAGETLLQPDCSVADFEKRLTEQIPLLKAFVNMESGRLEALKTILSKSEILGERTRDFNSFREGLGH